MSSTRRLLGLEQPIKLKKMKKKGKSKMITDERFASAQSDPRFMEAPKRHSKVSIDSRFQRIFTDRSFASSNAPVDKRGKPKINNQRAAVSQYYQQEADDQIGKQIESESESESEGGEDEDVDVDVETVSSSSTTDSEDDNYVDEEEGDTFMLQEDNVPEIDKETKRLAVVNLDWSQVRAVDLYALLTSFLPKEGRIISVSVYPSEFGLKRMEEEATRGPVGLFDDEHVEVFDDYDDDDDEIDQKKLRAYELSRLRYYYAVVECDSVATSDYIYKTCDGVEFERSANKLDLRFIPDSMEFKHQPRDVATEIPSNYEGLDFQTRALQHSNIQLTWDEDEPQRAKTLKRKLSDKQIADLELKEYLASDESESEDDGEDKNCKKLDKYRALIQSGDQSDEDDEEDDSKQEMEVTFNSGLEEVSKRIIEKRNKKSESVWEAYLKKRKEKKKGSKKGSKFDSDDESDDSDEDPKDEAGDFFVEVAQETEASRAELELLTADDKLENDTNVKGYSLKPNKRKREAAIPTLDVEDPRFSALFTSPLYARDPTHPEFKRSAPYALQETQKQQKKKKTKSTKKRA